MIHAVRSKIVLVCTLLSAGAAAARAQVYCGMRGYIDVFLTATPHHISPMTLARVFPNAGDAAGQTDVDRLELRGPVRSIETRIVFRGGPDNEANVMQQEFDADGNLERTVFVTLAREYELEGRKRKVEQTEVVVEFRGVYEDGPHGRRLKERTFARSDLNKLREPGTQTFAYDDKGRLIEIASKAALPETCSTTEVWTFDDGGNLLRRALHTGSVPDQVETQEFKFSADGVCEAFCISRPGQPAGCMNFEQAGGQTVRIVGLGGNGLPLTVDDRGSLVEWDSFDDGGPHRMKQSIMYDDHGNWTRLEAQARYEHGPHPEWLPARRVERTIKYREQVKGD